MHDLPITWKKRLDTEPMSRRVLWCTRHHGPHILAAVDLRKAFDTVSHQAILESLCEAYPGKRVGNFVRAFLADRTFEVRVNRPHFKNTCGAPQGALTSPILFNIVMAKLIKGAAAITGVHVTAYADDVTIWMEANITPRLTLPYRACNMCWTHLRPS